MKSLRAHNSKSTAIKMFNALEPSFEEEEALRALDEFIEVFGLAASSGENADPNLAQSAASKILPATFQYTHANGLTHSYTCKDAYFRKKTNDFKGRYVCEHARSKAKCPATISLIARNCDNTKTDVSEPKNEHTCINLTSKRKLDVVALQSIPITELDITPQVKDYAEKLCLETISLNLTAKQVADQTRNYFTKEYKVDNIV